MFILKWWKQYLEIKAEFKERNQDSTYCESCETLKLQLAIANQEKRDLLDRFTNPIQTAIHDSDPDLKPLAFGKHLPFSARQQMLQREDRERAKLLKRNSDETAIKPSSEMTEKLERELGITESVTESER